MKKWIVLVAVLAAMLAPSSAPAQIVGDSGGGGGSWVQLSPCDWHPSFGGYVAWFYSPWYGHAVRYC